MTSTSTQLRRSAYVFLALAAAVVAICSTAQMMVLDEQSLLLRSGPLLILAVAAAVWWGRPGALAIVDVMAAPSSQPGRRQMWMLTLVALAALMLIASLVLNRFPSSPDEYAYVLQAKTYATGRLWVDAPPLPNFFKIRRYFAQAGLWVSPYQPGWPMVMAPAAALGLPLWTVNPVIGAATVVAFHALGRQLLSRAGAWIATLALVTSPFFLFNLASFFSHGVAGLAAIFFALFAVRYLRAGHGVAALIAGVCIGYLGFTRVFTAIPFMLVFAGVAAQTPTRRAGLIWFAIGGAPFLIALLALNAAVTGHALLMIQDWGLKGGEPVGGPNEQVLIETLRRSIRLVFWTSPVLVAAWLAALGWLARRRRLHFVDWIMPATMAGYLFYAGHGGDQFGPRYIYEAWPFVLLTVMRAAEPLIVTGPRRSALAASALLAHLTFQLAYTIPRLVREHHVIVERSDIYTLVKRAGLHDAVVIVVTGSGRLHPTPPDNLTRNGLDVTAEPVAYVMNLGARNRMLRMIYPRRAYYFYTHGVLKPASPSLIPDVADLPEDFFTPDR